MMNMICLAFLVLSLCVANSSPVCKVDVDEFRNILNVSHHLLYTMITHSTVTTTDDELAEDFPYDLYNQTFKAPVEKRVVFIKQVLHKVSKLLEKDHTSAPWDEQKVHNFHNTLERLAHELKHCKGSHNHNLTMHFESLSDHITQKDHSAAVWEVIRQEILTHLFKVDQLVASLKTKN